MDQESCFRSSSWHRVRMLLILSMSSAAQLSIELTLVTATTKVRNINSLNPQATTQVLAFHDEHQGRRRLDHTTMMLNEEEFRKECTNVLNSLNLGLDTRPGSAAGVETSRRALVSHFRQSRCVLQSSNVPTFDFVMMIGRYAVGTGTDGTCSVAGFGPRHHSTRSR